MRMASILSIIKASILSIVIGALSPPAFADDADIKKQVEQIASAYMDSYNKQNMDGVAALYASGGVLVNPSGVHRDIAQPGHTDIAQVLEGFLKAGFNQLDASVDQVWPLGSDMALAMGKYRYTGKNQSGDPIEAAGLWTATYVKEGGKLKIRMLSGIPQPPPAK